MSGGGGDGIGAYPGSLDRALRFIVGAPRARLFAGVVQADNVTAFCAGFKGVPDEEIERKQHAAAQYTPSHFSFCGLMDQISRFMLGRQTDLQCVPLPPSVRNQR